MKSTTVSPLTCRRWHITNSCRLPSLRSLRLSRLVFREPRRKLQNARRHAKDVWVDVARREVDPIRLRSRAEHEASLRCTGGGLEHHRSERKAMTLDIEIEREEDGRWIAEVPSLAGVLAQHQGQARSRRTSKDRMCRQATVGLPSYACPPRLSGLCLRLPWR